MLHTFKRLEAHGTILGCLHEYLLRFDSRWRLNLVKDHTIKHFVSPSVFLNDASWSENYATSAWISVPVVTSLLVDDSTPAIFFVWYDH